MMKNRRLMSVVVSALAVALSAPLVGGTASSAQKPEQHATSVKAHSESAKQVTPAKEMDVTGMVERSKRGGPLVLVTPAPQHARYRLSGASPIRKQLASLVGKTVEAKGTLARGPQGRQVFDIQSVEAVKPAK